MLEMPFLRVFQLVPDEEPMPDPASNYFFSEIDGARYCSPVGKGHALVSRAVPEAWAYPFTEVQRRYCPADGDEKAQVFYLDGIQAVRERLEERVSWLRRRWHVHQTLLDELVDLGNWLQTFPSDSLLMLHLAGLCEDYTETQLAVMHLTLPVETFIDKLRGEMSEQRRIARVL